MNHGEAFTYLEALAEGTLDRGTRTVVQAHVGTCETCTARLAELEPVDLTDLGGPAGDFDEERVRRSVRRALRRTAVDAAALTVIMVVLVGLLSLFVVQPLLLGRGDRAAVAARATYEMPMLFNPGVTVSRFRIESGLTDRVSTAESQLLLGSGLVPLMSASTRVGPFGIDVDHHVLDTPPAPIEDVLPGLGEGTVSTVAFDLGSPLEEEAAQELAERPGRDVRIIWVGFDVPSPLPTVGYPLCRLDLDLPDGLFDASSASAGGVLGTTAPSVARAVGSAAEALGVIASNDEVTDALGAGAAGSVHELAEWMAEGRPRIRTLVVTGPTGEVSAFLDDLGATGGSVLAVGFYNWGSPVCGR